jgi:hypothetical protein
MDAAGATLIWQAWNRTRPRNLLFRAENAWVFDNLAILPPKGSDARSKRTEKRVDFWRGAFDLLSASADVLALLGAVALDVAAMLHSHPTVKQDCRPASIR